MKRRDDWAKIKNEYITTEISLSALAKKRKCGYNALREKCRAEDWKAQRYAYREKIDRKALDRVAKDRAKELEGHNKRMAEDADALEGVIGGLLVRLAENGLDEIAAGRNPGREIESLSRAMLTLDELRRRTMGMSMPKDEQKLKLERERLEMDRCRLEQAQADVQELLVQFAEAAGREINE